MANNQEKRGPIEKGANGWPINPIGAVALLIFGLVIIFLIVKPLLQTKSQPIQLQEQSNSAGGKITSPNAGDIIRNHKVLLSLSVDEPQKVEKVQFWAKTYADGKWQMIGEISSSPYQFDWQIPPNFQNKAIAITSHISQKDGLIIKDPGGWREGIIILE